jgi:phosphocarrier protein HPr
MTGRSPFKPMPGPDGDALRAEPARFINPWADCWGDPASGMPVQMSASASAADAEQPAAEPCDPTELPAGTGAQQRVFPIINQRGLHARASAKFVQTVERFNAEIRVSRCGETVGGLSIMGLMMLAAARGTSISVEASGPEALQALDALEALVADKFGEEV